MIGLYSSAGWIWVQSGEPEHIAVLFLVHELAHAWQRENCPGQSDKLTEGFAVWLEYQCALDLNYSEYADLLERRQCPVYGGGLRACWHWEEMVGTQQMLIDICECTDFPPWLWGRQFKK